MNKLSELSEKELIAKLEGYSAIIGGPRTEFKPYFKAEIQVILYYLERIGNNKLLKSNEELKFTIESANKLASKQNGRMLGLTIVMIILAIITLAALLWQIYLAFYRNTA